MDTAPVGAKQKGIATCIEEDCRDGGEAPQVHVGGNPGQVTLPTHIHNMQGRIREAIGRVYCSAWCTCWIRRQSWPRRMCSRWPHQRWSRPQLQAWSTPSLPGSPYSTPVKCIHNVGWSNLELFLRFSKTGTSMSIRNIFMFPIPTKTANLATDAQQRFKF